VIDSDRALDYLSSLDPRILHSPDTVESQLTLCGFSVSHSGKPNELVVNGVSLPLEISEPAKTGILLDSIIRTVFRILTGNEAVAPTDNQSSRHKNLLEQLRNHAQMWAERRPDADTQWNGDACVWLDDDSTDRVTLQWADWFAPLALRFAKLSQPEQSTLDLTAIIGFAGRIGVSFETFCWDGVAGGGQVTLGILETAMIEEAQRQAAALLAEMEQSRLKDFL
jgi:hypothetical protein